MELFQTREEPDCDAAHVPLAMEYREWYGGTVLQLDLRPRKSVPISFAHPRLGAKTKDAPNLGHPEDWYPGRE